MTRSSSALETRLPGANVSASERSGLKILQYILRQRLPVGSALVAETVGEALGVSRFPVQKGLAWLRDQGLVSQPNKRGFVLSAPHAALRKRLADAAGEASSPYRVIAQDRLRGRLPKEVSETELAQRYGITRSQLGPILKRMAQEGWIRRRSGHGWQFTDIIDSAQSFSDAYTFRMAIEPAALLAPTFLLDRAVLSRLGEEQAALRDGRLGRISGEELFEIGSRFHETLAGFSGNPFFVAAVQQVNRLRRLVEYRAMARPADFMEQCREHLTLIDLLERGERRQAAEFMRRHLDIARNVKHRALDGQYPVPGEAPAAHF